MNRITTKFLSWISRLHIEEVIALVFFIPSFMITVKANLYFSGAGLVIPRRFYGGFTRLAVTLLLMVLYFYFLERYDHKPFFRWVRNTMPFLFCIAIYTNLHDTIGFINPHDIDNWLIAADQFLFGVQPCVWAQQFYHPLLTDYLSLSYMNYFLIVVVVVVYLILKKKEQELRTVLLGTILTFYIGYALYIIFPAASPSKILANEFTRDFSGGWLTRTEKKLIRMDPTSARGAFPSLHNAVTLITLMYAYVNSKKLFWILLIPAISLVISTIYLRHHYAIDLFAGWLLAVLTYYIAPYVDRWWEGKRLKLAERTR